MNDNSFPIVEAKVLSYYDNPIELNKRMNELLQEGWELYSGLSVTIISNPNQLVYSQMMVKRNHDQFTAEVVGG